VLRRFGEVSSPQACCTAHVKGPPMVFVLCAVAVGVWPCVWVTLFAQVPVKLKMPTTSHDGCADYQDLKSTRQLCVLKRSRRVLVGGNCCTGGLLCCLAALD
jgi:hypothetical protein